MDDKSNMVIFNIKVEDELKERFLRVAKENDTDGSKEVRKFMKEYLSKNSQLSLKV